MKTNSSESTSSKICIIKTDSSILLDDSKIATHFNKYFINFVSPFFVTYDESTDLINNTFLYLKTDNFLRTLHFVSNRSILGILNIFNASFSAESSNIPEQIIKHCFAELSIFLTYIFNSCIKICLFPD